MESHVVVTPSQVMELPGTLVQDVAGVHCKVPPEQLVVHIVWAPTKLTMATIAKRPERIRTFRMFPSFCA